MTRSNQKLNENTAYLLMQSWVFLGIGKIYDCSFGWRIVGDGRALCHGRPHGLVGRQFAGTHHIAGSGTSAIQLAQLH